MSDKQKPADIKFNSADIGRKGKVDYFDGRVKQNPFQKFLKFAFKGFHKFISIGIIVLVAAGITVLILWLTVWRPAATSDSSGSGEDPAAQVDPWHKEVVDVSDKAYELLESDSDSSYLDAMDYFDEQITAQEDFDRAFDLRIAKASFLNNNGGSQLAVDDLTQINAEQLTDEQKYELYLALSFAYYNLGDRATFEMYEAKIDGLPKSVTVKGETETPGE